jgi:HTH-type transcriptional regulator / antitoxin HigA
MTTLVEAWEDRHYPIDKPDPIEAVRFRLAQQSLDSRALIGVMEVAVEFTK